MHTLKKFIHYYKPYKFVFFFDLFCAALISAVDLVYPQFLRSMTNTLFKEDSEKILKVLPWLAAGLFVMYIIQTLCKYYVSYQGHVMGAKMERDMRKELFDHYEKLSFSYYDKNNSGQMMSKLVSDLFDISEFAHHGPENLFIAVIKLVGSFFFLFHINWQLALPMVLLAVCMAFFSVKQNRRMQETPAYRILSPVSAWSSPLLMKISKERNLKRATRPFWLPRTITTSVWEPFREATCSSRE